VHPGWGNSPLIDGNGTIDDLGLSLSRPANQLELENAALSAHVFGRWVAGGADGPLGLRGFTQLVLVIRSVSSSAAATSATSLTCLPCACALPSIWEAWADPARGEIDFTKLPDSELAAIVRAARHSRSMAGTLHAQSPRKAAGALRVSTPDQDLAACGGLRTAL